MLRFVLRIILRQVSGAVTVHTPVVQLVSLC